MDILLVLSCGYFITYPVVHLYRTYIVKPLSLSLEFLVFGFPSFLSSIPYNGVYIFFMVPPQTKMLATHRIQNILKNDVLWMNLLDRVQDSTQ